VKRPPPLFSPSFYYHIRNVHNIDMNAALACPIEGCQRSFKSVPGLEYHLQRHVDGKIRDNEGRILPCDNLKAAKRRAMHLRKASSLKADEARELAASVSLTSVPKQ
jgi:hypothetical protein